MNAHEVPAQAKASIRVGAPSRVLACVGRRCARRTTSSATPLSRLVEGKGRENGAAACRCRPSTRCGEVYGFVAVVLPGTAFDTGGDSRLLSCRLVRHADNATRNQAEQWFRQLEASSVVSNAATPNPPYVVYAHSIAFCVGRVPCEPGSRRKGWHEAGRPPPAGGHLHQECARHRGGLGHCPSDDTAALHSLLPARIVFARTKPHACACGSAGMISQCPRRMSSRTT